MSKQIYIAGPMCGVAFYNYPAFFAAAERWQKAGWLVVNPAGLNEGRDGFAPGLHAEFVSPEYCTIERMPHDAAYYLWRDLPYVASGGAIAMLPGWEKSEGARIELAVAQGCGLEVYDAVTSLELKPQKMLVDPMQYAKPVAPVAAEPNDEEMSEAEAKIAAHTVASFVARQIPWSQVTFGHGARTGGLLKHIAKELEEIKAKPHDLTEWMDVVILALDGAWRAGYTPVQIEKALEKKQQVNFSRIYQMPVSEDEPAEHLRIGGVAPVFENRVAQAMAGWNAQFCKRTFASGATRDTDEGKLDFDGFLSHAVLSRYAEYMHKHRQMADGSLRDSDNWQKGIPREQYRKSAWRHFMDWWNSHRTGQNVEEAACALLFNVMGDLHEALKADAAGKEGGK